MREQIVAGVKSVLRPIVRHRALVERAKYVGQAILGPAAGNQRIGDLLASGEPAAVGKMGASELGGLRHYQRCKDAAGRCDRWGRHATMLHRNAGVFPADPDVFGRFCRVFGESLGQLDVMAAWFQRGEAKLRARFAPAATLVSLTALEPFFHPDPWSKRLAGKRVVVVSPFAATIREQYARREQVWRAAPDVLPAFDLRVVRCPLSAALTAETATAAYPDWFAALDALRAAMSAEPFDAAIIGAGAWGVPLAAHAKACGAFGIHLGGPTQLLFGVRGGRWDANADLARFYNDAWVRPGPADRPDTFRAIENGCYW